MSGKKNREDRSGHSCALIYEPTTTPVSITVQQDDHITKLVTQTKTKTLWNVREPDRGHGRTRQNTTEHDRADTEHTNVINILCADPLYVPPVSSIFISVQWCTTQRAIPPSERRASGLASHALNAAHRCNYIYIEF